MRISVFDSATDMPPPLYYQADTFVRITWADDPEYDIDEGFEDPAMHVALHRDHTLFSYASIIRQKVMLENAAFICYGVASVFTFPASRRKGYARRVLGACEQLIRGMPDADVALLWTEAHNRPIYEKAGWMPLPNMLTLYGDPDHPETYHDETAMMMFFSDRAIQAEASFAHGKLFVGDEPW